jgi:hypothetical protein
MPREKAHDLKSPRFAGDPALEACYDNKRLLRVGDSGPAVVKIQQALIDAGFPLPRFGADGDFGAETKAAVQNYQRAHGLAVDGIIGPTTMGSLDAQFASTPPAPSSNKDGFWYTVKSGDWLDGIAKRNGLLSWKDIYYHEKNKAHREKRKDPNKLYPGDQLWIPTDSCLPKYEPHVWNDNDGIQLNNNCYNYACDIQTNTFAQPGKAHGITLPNSNGTCDDVSAGATADGLNVTNCDQGCGYSECHHQVALVIKPGKYWDYHWYRKDRDGKWSHKQGGSPVTNLDNSDNIINDPRTAERGVYTIFCGCYCVNKRRVTIK